jgi:competence protein ComEC
MLVDPGFQMSFSAVLAITTIHLPLMSLMGLRKPRTDLPSEKRRSVADIIGRYVFSIAAVSTIACLASTPIAAFHFGRIAPLAPLFSILLFPLVVTTILLGVAGVMSSIVSPGLGQFVAGAAERSAGALHWWVKTIANVSPSLQRNWLAVATELVFVILLVVVFWRVIVSINVGDDHARLRRDRSLATLRYGAVLVLGLLIVVTAGAVGTLRTIPRDGLRITQLAVGRGSATVLEFPNGKTWIYDCGSNQAYDVGEGTVVPYLRSRRINRVDRIFISHPSMDHLNGVLSICDGVDTGPIVINAYFEQFARSDGPADGLLKELRRRKLPIEIIGPIETVSHRDYSSARSSETSWTVGDAIVEFVWPPFADPAADPALDDSADPFADPSVGLADHPAVRNRNESSTVLRITYAGRSILLTGDIRDRALSSLLSDAPTADVLVMPNHGAIGRHTAEFVSAVSPSVCLASTNRADRRGWSELTEPDEHVEFFNTDDDGAITVTLANDTLRVSTFRNRRTSNSPP